MKTKKGLIIWDLDGTLINSLPSTLEAFNDGIEPYTGRRLSHSEIMTFFGPSEDRVVARIVGEERAAECYQRVLKSTQERLKDILPFDGIVETLENLRAQDLALSILTGRGRHSTDIILEHLGLRKHFLEILTHTELTNGKPHPEGIFKICKAAGIGVTKAVMVGDSPLDMQAGRKAGTTTVGCIWDARANRTVLEEAKAQLVIDHPRQLLPPLLNLLNRAKKSE